MVDQSLLALYAPVLHFYANMHRGFALLCDQAQRFCTFMRICIEILCFYANMHRDFTLLCDQAQRFYTFMRLGIEILHFYANMPRGFALLCDQARCLCAFMRIWCFLTVNHRGLPLFSQLGPLLANACPLYIVYGIGLEKFRNFQALRHSRNALFKSLIINQRSLGVLAKWRETM